MTVPIYSYNQERLVMRKAQLCMDKIDPRGDDIDMENIDKVNELNSCINGELAGDREWSSAFPAVNNEYLLKISQVFKKEKGPDTQKDYFSRTDILNFLSNLREKEEPTRPGFKYRRGWDLWESFVPGLAQNSYPKIKIGTAIAFYTSMGLLFLEKMNPIQVEWKPQVNYTEPFINGGVSRPIPMLIPEVTISYQSLAYRGLYKNYHETFLMDYGYNYCYGAGGDKNACMVADFYMRPHKYYEKLEKIQKRNEQDFMLVALISWGLSSAISFWQQMHPLEFDQSANRDHKTESKQNYAEPVIGFTSYQGSDRTEAGHKTIQPTIGVRGQSGDFSYSLSAGVEDLHDIRKHAPAFQFGLGYRF